MAGCSGAVVSSGFGAVSAGVGGVSPYDVMRVREAINGSGMACVCASSSSWFTPPCE